MMPRVLFWKNYGNFCNWTLALIVVSQRQIRFPNLSIILESDRPCSDIHAKKIWRREDTYTPKTHAALAREDRNLSEKEPLTCQSFLEDFFWFVVRNGYRTRLHYAVLSAVLSPSNSWCDIVRSCIGTPSTVWFLSTSKPLFMLSRWRMTIFVRVAWGWKLQSRNKPSLKHHNVPITNS